MRFRVIVAAAAVGLLAPALGAQKTADGDWPMYGRDLAGTKFSPLKQVTAENVSRLQPAWNLTLVERPAPVPGQGRGRGPGGPEILSNPEVTPIVVNGVMYLLAAGNQIMALDAATGKEIWRFSIPDGDSTGRGLAYWPGDRNNPERVMFTASAPKGKPGGARLVALDAATGKPSEGFGTNGMADVGVPWNGVPLVFKNVVDPRRHRRRSAATVRQVTRARSTRAPGRSSGSFTPCRGPARTDTTRGSNDGWKSRSGVNVWGWYMTVDEQRGILYMPIAGPAANYWGGDRPGNNLFANSIVAVDAETGKYKWHFQTVHHDLWDSDMPSPPTLVDIRQNGRTIPALASVGKTGYMFILDRVTGKPIFGVEERPVPKGERPRRMVFADAAVSGEAAAAHARRVQEGRHGDGRRHIRRSREGVPGTLGQERRVLQCRAGPRDYAFVVGRRQ